MTTHHRFRKALLVLAIAVTGLAVLWWFVFGTRAGAWLAIAAAERYTPLRIGESSGRLRGPLLLRDLRIDAGGTSVAIDRAYIDWRPVRLLLRRAWVDSLDVEGVRVGLPEREGDTQREAEPASRLALPLEVSFAVGRVRDVEIAAPGGTRAEVKELSFSGDLNDFAFRADGRFQTADIREARFAAEGRGSLDSLRLEPLTVQVLGGHLELRGVVARYPNLAWQLTVRGDSLAPAPLTPEPSAWPGRLSFRMTSSGSLGVADRQLRVQLDTLRGDLRQQPLAGAGDLEIEGDRYRTNGFNLAWGAATARIAGELVEEFDLEVEVRAPDLALTLPNAGGSLRIDGAVSGPRESPRLRAAVAAAELRFREHRVETVSGRLDVDLGDPRGAVVDLDALGVRVAGQRLDTVRLHGRGTEPGAETAGINLHDIRVDLLDGRLAGDGTIAWRPHLEWHLAISVTDLAPGSLAPRPADWPGRLSLRVRTRGAFSDAGPEGELTVDSLTGTLRGQSVAGAVSLAGSPERYELRALSLYWGSGTVRAHGSMVRDRLDLNMDLEFPDLGLAVPGGAGSLRGRARVLGSPDLPEIDATLTARELEAGELRLAALEGSARLGLTGRDSVEIEVRGAGLQVGDYRLARVELRGHGIRSGNVLVGLEVDRAEADLYQGRIAASGQVRWRPRPAWRLQLEGADLVPAPLLPEPDRWPGRLSFRASSDGVLEAVGPNARLRVDTLHGVLRDEPLAGRLDAAVEGREYTVSNVELDWGRSRLSGRGRVSDELDVELDLEVPDLAVSLPQASGSLTATARLRGPPLTPRLAARIDARALAYEQYSIGRLQGQATLDLRDRLGEVELQLSGAELSVGEYGVQQIELRGGGTRSNHELALRLSGSGASGELQLSGSYDSSAWEGTVRRLEVEAENAGAWRLGSPAGLTLSPTAVNLETLCLRSPNGRVCLEGRWANGAGWRLASTIRDLPLAVLDPLMPPRWTLTGSLDGDVSVATDGGLRADVTLVPGPGEFTYPLGEEARTARYQGAELRLRVDEAGLRARGALRLVDAGGSPIGFLESDLELPGYTTLTQPLPAQQLTGELRGRLDDLTIVEGILTNVARTRGRIEVRVAADGTVGHPQLTGAMSVREAEADIPRLGVRIRSLELTVSGDGSGKLSFRGEAASGPGRVTVTGESLVTPTRENPTRLHISGERFQVANIPEAVVLVSPDVEIRLAPEFIGMSGEVRVPRASIELKEIPETAVQVSRDVVYVAGANREPLTAPTTASGRVRIVLGQDVSFKGFGFTANLRGSLLAIEEPDKPTSGSGELVIADGSYRAYGQRLSIDRGRVLFGGGPIDNPGLDVRATRTASDGTVAGLLITGTLRSPEVSLFSEPPLPESEALSYLVLGRPLGEVSSAEGSALTRAATGLGLRGGSLLAARIANTLGLDEARVERGRSLRDISLVAGKYLSPRLYVAYGIGVFDQESTFRVRYLLSSRWTLAGETGEATSADVLYRLERGQ